MVRRFAFAAGLLVALGFGIALMHTTHPSPVGVPCPAKLCP
jgi:hypothetical protein